MQMRHFRYFIAAAEEGSFLKAATRLRVAQPSLSRQMRDLERDVGVALFERLPRGVRLTPAGEAFLKEARNTLECAARAVATARHEGAPNRTLRIGHSTLAHYSLKVAKLVAAFRRDHPDTNVSIRRLNETSQRAAIREHRIDIGISFIATPIVEELKAFHLIETPITGVVLPANHELACAEVVSLADLRDLTWLRIARKSSPELYRTLKAALLSRGLSPSHERPWPRDPSAASMHIAAGNVWMLANEEISHAFTDGNSALVYRKFAEQPIPCWLALLWRGANAPNVEGFLDVARAI